MLLVDIDFVQAKAGELRRRNRPRNERGKAATEVGILSIRDDFLKIFVVQPAVRTWCTLQWEGKG